MPYNKFEPYQKHFTRWVNGRCGCEWEDYEPMKKIFVEAKNAK